MEKKTMCMVRMEEKRIEKQRLSFWTEKNQVPIQRKLLLTEQGNKRDNYKDIPMFLTIWLKEMDHIESKEKLDFLGESNSTQKNTSQRRPL